MDDQAIHEDPFRYLLFIRSTCLLNEVGQLKPSLLNYELEQVDLKME